MNLKVGDTVGMDDAFGNNWTGGVITTIRGDEIYVRWPDSVIGIFDRKYANHLKKETPCTP